MKIKISVLATAILWFAALSFGQQKPAGGTRGETFKTSPLTIEKIVAEDTYYFKISQYTPPVNVKLIKPEEASYVGPEEAAISAISAMASKDFSWYRRTWTEASQRMMEERDKALNRAPSFWTELWDKSFKNRRVEMTYRIETGDYVLIVYRLVAESGNLRPTDTPAADIELITVLKYQEGKWLATQELAQDPVLLYWKTPNVIPKRVIRGTQQN